MSRAGAVLDGVDGGTGGAPSRASREQAVAAALAATRRGDLVLLPTESSYALAADAFSLRGAAAMRAAKGTDAGTPLPVIAIALLTIGTGLVGDGLSRAAAGIDRGRDDA